VFSTVFVTAINFGVLGLADVLWRTG